MDVRNDLIKHGRLAQGATIWVTDYSQEYGFFSCKRIKGNQPLFPSAYWYIDYKSESEYTYRTDHRFSFLL